jgi:hypothetical protein
VRTAIGSIVADAESAFDDGWPLHPQDQEDDDDPATRFRTLYLGGAGVVDALHRLARRGFVELRRDYVPYLERSLEAPTAGRPTGAAATRSGPATSARPSTSPTAPTGEGSYPSHRTIIRPARVISLARIPQLNATRTQTPRSAHRQSPTHHDRVRSHTHLQAPARPQSHPRAGRPDALREQRPRVVLGSCRCPQRVSRTPTNATPARR